MGRIVECQPTFVKGIIIPSRKCALSVRPIRTLTLTVSATDDITPASGITMAATAISGGALVSAMTLGPVASDGTRTLTITPTANAAGVATIRIQAADAGGHAADPVEFTFTVAATPDMPTIEQFSPTAGTSGKPGGLALNLTPCVLPMIPINLAASR